MSETKQITWRKQTWTVTEKVRTLPNTETCFVCRGNVVAGELQVQGSCGTAHARCVEPKNQTVTFHGAAHSSRNPFGLDRCARCQDGMCCGKCACCGW